jgi:hypothetical protein
MMKPAEPEQSGISPFLTEEGGRRFEHKRDIFKECYISWTLNL